MPKGLFYTGTAFCLFLALASAAGLTQQLHGQTAFVAMHGAAISTATSAAWAIVVALIAGMAVAAILLRMVALLADAGVQMHFAAVMMLGWFLSLSFLALRPYFRVQASRFLSASVFFPLPLYLLILLQELFVTGSRAALPSVTPASLVFFAATALLFFAISVHCIRHRHMFLEMTNLRELLESRLDHGKERVIGRVAYDS